MAPVAVTAFTSTTALGAGLAAQVAALTARRSGLRRNDFGPQPLHCWIGRVDGVEDVVLPDALQGWDCRNNRLAWLALQQDGLAAAVQAAAQRYGAARVAVLMGTSTSSVGASEEAYTRLIEDADGARFPDDLDRLIVHTPHSLGDFVQHANGLGGPCVTVATACSSSAKVFAQAARLIDAGVVDAALVGGVDTLCGSVLFGFNALQVVAQEPCQPFDARRVGLSLGEAGGFALLERPAAAPDAALWLYGYGESSDAHHMSAPHPQGLGAQMAMRGALERAGLQPAAVGYLNLHGTATPANDSVEAAAVAAVFPDTLHASSTKAWAGHTLGAAGIVESVIALLALRDGVLPGTLNSEVPDPACGPQIRFDNAYCRIDYAMNNSFGFGGNNCSLLFGRAR
ncbi:beta-ketoacyl-[acyl-carrier-protein] synthase family protein [Xanthomonas fragariae]|uniref:3-oxoacyl-ACP synthase n=7 Tax=Xanthomonas fragariae TaxID=48664 RepID=A0A1Y6HEB5_9XANT|nr:beta-ketoacyl-[acyl-carrier-protein] synthase family protein [Xanthomonas fragariae]AOD16455.1 beta-ketoacyl-[acyl-carrier-protein] synthase II [Xanthomonas fragariae]AOD19888.1 beta-ketoacyl-[acyl-carrier-protein] synthase II [Xanthomonas fragariae]ENZ95133.1 3-oxoacyl-(acyl carrier protein) synthase I [Xanthomonas fragariae LMG 25863]MBL9197407.1 beta-ketoacyl-[acyl-carrier-protein] synthase family protein [Xanthomonas fragariae]MBL9222544.1 beta-ketoacyl-[acyl-carrier-protein] synthase f